MGHGVMCNTIDDSTIFINLVKKQVVWILDFGCCRLSSLFSVVEQQLFNAWPNLCMGCSTKKVDSSNEPSSVNAGIKYAGKEYL